MRATFRQSTVGDRSTRLRLLSNIKPTSSQQEIEYAYYETGSIWIALPLWWKSFRSDVILLENNPACLWLLCLLRWLVPFGSCRLVVVDINFVKPRGVKQRVGAWVRKLLLRRVSHFIHFFKDLDGYQRYFGIGPERSSYTPFKVNNWSEMPPRDELSSDGDYVFTGGRSLRDLTTFGEAMRRVSLPGLIVFHDLKWVNENGTELDLDRLPSNVRAVEDDGTSDSWQQAIRAAKLVVLPTHPDAIRAIGISTYLEAMALGKCVIISEGPATREILSDEAIIVPAADPEALARAIQEAWNDEERRRATAERGRDYAERVEGEERLMRDVLTICRKVVADIHRRTTEKCQ